MKVLVLGADGYLGRPTVDYLRGKGHEVFSFDSFWKYKQLEQFAIHAINNNDRGSSSYCDITTDVDLEYIIAGTQPDAIIDYAEIPSAPYSMIGHIESDETIRNNTLGTLNLANVVRDCCPDTHIIKLGTMGEYGVPNIDIEEGFLDITHNGRQHRALYPKEPGSIYHLSKVFDSDLLYFACRMWGLRVTDLNQGFVYGTHENTRFCYDDLFGTALNRFIVQAVVGHPLTVYGKGGQTRGIINLIDTLQCVELALENPAQRGEFRVYNQFTEQASIIGLAQKVAAQGKRMGLNVKIDNIPNPRKEAEDHYYNAKHTKLPALGLKPHLLTNDVIAHMIEFVREYQGEINVDQILPKVKW